MKYKIPWIPISALIFYCAVLVLWSFNLIPPPSEVVSFLENLYNNYGLIGLSIATFLEGIVYLGLYFPGSFIILLSVILSDGTLISLFNISFVVALTLTVTSIINYWLGRYFVFKNPDKFDPLFSKKNIRGLLYSSIHPNLLAFYFFNEGINKKSPKKLIYVPFLMLFVGLCYSFLVYSFKLIVKNQIEKPQTMIILILIWFSVVFIYENKRKLK